ncbi:MAG TPA: HAMP domain-containing sensor histidine kinase [Candidatus Saccharimonadaceae bacterium]|nr:HAMP domain-containing sensor histidine kinase [Candidatus Saccharimonadaceae bacterium]
MFESATLKLTAWYIAILMSISVLFSIAIFMVASNEVSARLAGLQHTIEQDGTTYFLPPSNDFLDLRHAQAHTAAIHLFFSLLYANIVVLIAGGAGAYFLAKRTLEPIERAHDGQSRFVSDASHELRTPLAAMQTELEVTLRDPHLTIEDARETLASNLEEVQKLSRLTTALLQLSKSDATELEMQAVDIAKLVKNIVKRYDPHGSRLNLQAPKTELFTFANDISLEELFTILVDNALKYSPKKSPIDLSLSRDHSVVLFTITNSGKGIPADQLPYIFDRFYQADRARSPHGKNGFGLGLALAKKIVELHHGNLSVRSGTDHPTTFTVSLPVSRNIQAKTQ